MYAKNFKDWTTVNEINNRWRDPSFWSMIDLDRDIYSEDPDVLYRVATHPDCPIEYLELLAQSWSDIARIGVASNENTPSKILYKLSFDIHPNVLHVVAQNPNTSPNAFKNLIDYSYKEVYSEMGYDITLAAMKNPSCPIELVIKVSKYKGDDVGKQHLSRTASSIIDQRLREADPDERNRIERTINMADLGVDLDIEGDIDLENLKLDF